MQVEVGNIVEGRVTGITHFGAFIALGEGKTGMVHISEVSNSYVKDIKDYLDEDQSVNVKVISIADDGKIGLSIKQCEENKEEKRPQKRAASRPRNNNRPSRPQGRTEPPKDLSWQPRQPTNSDNMSFEDMMSKFKQASNDRMSELKRANDPRRSRRGNSSR